VGRLADIKGWQLEQRGEYAAAEASFREGLEHYREVGDEEAWAIAARLSQADLKTLINTQRGKLERDRGNWTASWHYFSLVQDWFEQRTEQTPLDEELAVGTWGHLAFVAYQLGRPEEARELCLRSLAYFEGRGTKGYYAALIYRLTLAESALGSRTSTLQQAIEALEWFTRLGMTPDVPAAQMLVTALTNP